jgi:L-fuconolactonase
MKLDAHNHFWNYSPTEHIWMDDRMTVLKRNYLPNDLESLLKASGFDGTVAVQARQSLEETCWLLDLAAQYPFIKGIVGWVDLRSPELRSQLQEFSKNPKFVGVRHVVHDEPDDDFMMGAEFRRGIGQLKEFKLTYDLLLFPKHLPIAARLVEEFPEQPFVIDHIAKPEIKNQKFSPWKEDIGVLAKFPNVYCKLSGMVTEAAWGEWRLEDFHGYLDVVFNAFGSERLMIGSDWPVCNLSADYEATMKIVTDYIDKFPIQNRESILGGNCTRFYRL